ncbi:MAG: hypothetical protein KKA19_09035 [Candidatus Margulisbacteria bacterium]|nr:hypothetical protein [Candidatus Margulisiibacteriota bacterium]
MSRTDLIGRLYKSRKKQQGGDRGNQYTKVASPHFEDLPKENIDDIFFKEHWEEKKTPKKTESYL